MQITKEKIDNISKTLTFKFPYTTDDYFDNLYMENYHYHSSFSNSLIADSPSSNEDYAKKIKEYSSKCIFSGEHGSQGNAFEVYELSEKYKLKYCHSTEAYWVKDRFEKDKTNCHICLTALNENGKGDINFALSKANEDGFYHRPRIDISLLKDIPPDNVVVTSACLAGWLYEDAEDCWETIHNHFKDNFFIEVQTHDTVKQKELNKRIVQFAEQKNIQIICGLDSHYVDESSDKVKRDIVLQYKNINYPDEDGWYLDYPDTEEVIKRFEKQNVLSERQILQSIMNTNVFVAKCEEIKFDRHFKLPTVYTGKTYEEKCAIFKNLLNQEYKKEKLKSDEKIKGIKYEVNEIIGSGTVDYFLTNYHILKQGIKNGGILTTTSRGSMASFIVNKLLGFTTIDRYNSEIPIFPERFLTKDRVLAGQLPDCDFNVAEQEPFVRASREIIGEHSCYPIMAIEQIKEKSAWQMYASVNGIEPSVANAVSKNIDEYNQKLKYCDEDDKEFIHIEEFIEKQYVDIYKHSIEYQGIVINLKVHACGHLLLEKDIRREIGLISAISETTGKRTLCACVEGKYLDSFGFCKNDFLIVDVVGLIKECFDSIDEPVPTFDELREMIRGDEPTWDIYKNGIVMCVNQVEKSSTAKKAQLYQMKDLGESSAFIAGIRPGFKSLLPNFLSRNPYTTGEPKIDELLKDSSFYLIYQESIMRVLSFLGLEMGETYTVIKNISKKKYAEHPEKLKELQSKLKKGWIEKIGNLDNFNKVWQVINDASRYSFNAPHSLSMGGDSAYIAWFKAHHTSKFYEVAINHYFAKDKKIKIDSLISEAMNFYDYKVKGFKFGDDNRVAKVNDDKKEITLIMSSIKDMQKITPQILYNMKNNKYNNFVELYQDLDNNRIDKKKIDSKSINILISLNYFSEFGSISYLQSCIKYCNLYQNSKTISKEKLNEYEIKCIQGCYEKETAKQFKNIDNNKFIENLLLGQEYPDDTIQSLIKNEVSKLGYTNLTDKDAPHSSHIVLGCEVNAYGTPFIKLYQLSSGISITRKADKKWFKDFGLEKADIINCSFDAKDKVRKATDEEFSITGKKWIKTGETEIILKMWSKVQ